MHGCGLQKETEVPGENPLVQGKNVQTQHRGWEANVQPSHCAATTQ